MRNATDWSTHVQGKLADVNSSLITTLENYLKYLGALFLSKSLGMIVFDDSF